MSQGLVSQEPGVPKSVSCNNRPEPDHRAVKRRIRPMLGIEALSSARVILSGAEMIHMTRTGQANCTCNSNLPHAEQFEPAAA
nr:DDE-type integrase/transposase/recombinase [Microvirga makkahensis]